MWNEVEAEYAVIYSIIILMQEGNTEVTNLLKRLINHVPRNHLNRILKKKTRPNSIH